MCLAAFNAVSSPLSAQIDEQALLARAQVVAAKMRQCGFTATDMLSDDEFTKNIGGRFRDAAEQYIAFIRRPDTTIAQMNERAAELARNNIVGLVAGSEAKTLADEGDIEFPDPHPVTAARTGQCPYPDWFWGWSMKSYEAFEKTARPGKRHNLNTE